MTTSDEAEGDFLADADRPLPDLPTAREVVDRAARLQAAARAAEVNNGGNRPVASGSSMPPQLRIRRTIEDEK